MAISFDPAVIADFFGTHGEVHGVADSTDRILWIDYTGPALKYCIMLHLDSEMVAISGDTKQPFGGDSMYEVAVPCSSIISGPDGYHPGQTFLSFYYGNPDSHWNRQMTVMKTPAGELKVWPAHPFPPGHRYAGQKVTNHA